MGSLASRTGNLWTRSREFLTRNSVLKIAPACDQVKLHGTAKPHLAKAQLDPTLLRVGGCIRRKVHSVVSFKNCGAVGMPMPEPLGLLKRFYSQVMPPRLLITESMKLVVMNCV